jgi:hypothetical protein
LLNYYSLAAFHKELSRHRLEDGSACTVQAAYRSCHPADTMDQANIMRTGFSGYSFLFEEHACQACGLGSSCLDLLLFSALADGVDTVPVDISSDSYRNQLT